MNNTWPKLHGWITSMWKDVQHLRLSEEYKSTPLWDTTSQPLERAKLKGWTIVSSAKYFDQLKLIHLWCKMNQQLRKTVWQFTKWITLLAVLGLSYCAWASSSRGAQRLLCCGARAPAPGWPASLAEVHGLSHPTACGILPGQGANSRLLHWQLIFFFTTEPPRKSQPFLK